jgi:hypothetical protein
LVIDVDDVIRDELERLAPAGETPRDDWGRILAAARTPAATHSRRRRLALVGAAACLVFTAPALAFSDGIRSLLGLGRPRPVLAKATLVVSAPVGNGFYAHLWHSPSTTGGRCAMTTAARGAMPRRLLVRRGGGACSVRGTGEVGRATREHPLVVGISIQRRPAHGVRTKWVPPIVSGNVQAGLHATRVRIEWPRGSHALVLARGYFIGGTKKLYMPPFADFPFYVVAYDARGREVARKKLESPTLRLMRHGWKQYAREYRAWKRSQHR